MSRKAANNHMEPSQTANVKRSSSTPEMVLKIGGASASLAADVFKSKVRPSVSDIVADLSPDSRSQLAAEICRYSDLTNRKIPVTINGKEYKLYGSTIASRPDLWLQLVDTEYFAEVVEPLWDVPDYIKEFVDQVQKQASAAGLSWKIAKSVLLELIGEPIASRTVTSRKTPPTSFFEYVSTTHDDVVKRRMALAEILHLTHCHLPENRGNISLAKRMLGNLKCRTYSGTACK